jgi:hypothetical protein
VSQRARPELHSPAIPGNHPSSRDEPGGLGARLCERPEARHLHIILTLGECGIDVFHRVGGTVKWDRGTAVRHLSRLRRSVQGGAQGGAIVAGCGLNVDVVEKAGAEELAVGRAIEGDSPGEGEASQSQLLPEVTAEMQHGLVEALL